MNDTDIEICYLSASDTLKKYKEKKLYWRNYFRNIGKYAYRC